MEFYVPMFGGLVGALVGGLVSFAVVRRQFNNSQKLALDENRRQLMFELIDSVSKVEHVFTVSCHSLNLLRKKSDYNSAIDKSKKTEEELNEKRKSIMQEVLEGSIHIRRSRAILKILGAEKALTAFDGYTMQCRQIHKKGEVLESEKLSAIQELLKDGPVDFFNIINKEFACNKH